MTTRAKRAANKRRLTELYVRKLKPKATDFLVWDTHQHGLALRVRESGNKSWKCIYSRHGRPRWLHLGNADAISLGDARTLAARAMLAVAEGKDPAAEKKAERAAGTFAELHERYLEGHAKKRNKSWQQADALIRRHAIPKWGKLQASSITRGDIKQMMTRIEAPIVANQTLAAVSAIFTWAVSDEMVATNPCKAVPRNPTRSRERVLADSEVPLFWKALDDIDLTRAAALRMILMLGQRPGEVAHMRREHLKDGWWEMPGEPVPALGWPGLKNKQSHRVWLPAPAQAAMAELSDDAPTGFVFRGKLGGPIHGLDAAMRDICSKLGVERATPHDLRRTHGSTVTALGFGRDAMNRIQNHKEGGIADVYDRHRYEAETKHIMESVADRIMTVIDGGAESDKVIRFTR